MYQSAVGKHRISFLSFQKDFEKYSIGISRNQAKTTNKINTKKNIFFLHETRLSTALCKLFLTNSVKILLYHDERCVAFFDVPCVFQPTHHGDWTNVLMIM